MPEVNLCPNPSLSVNATGWFSFVSTPSVTYFTSAVEPVHGMSCPYALVIRPVEDSPRYLFTANSPYVPVVAGQQFTYTWELRLDGWSTGAVARLVFSSETSSYVSAVGSAVSLVAGVARRVPFSGIVPATATRAMLDLLIVPRADNPYPDSSALSMTGARATTGSVDRGLQHADGDSPGWSWDGAPGLSVSRDTPSASWVAAIESGNRRPQVSARADWVNNGYDHPLADLNEVTQTLSVERSIASSLPAEIGLVEGATSTRAAIALAGRWRETLNLDPDSPNVASRVSPSDALAPYRPDAPLFGVPIVGVPFTADTGILSPDGRKLSRRFTGSVAALHLKASEQSAQVDLLDGANRLRAPVDLPAHAADSMLVSKFGQQGYSHRINSHFLIDYALRRNGVYASPPAHPQAIISATLHGSTIPELGYGGLTRPAAASLPGTSAWAYGGHPFGVMYPNRAVGRITGVWYRDIPTTTRNGSGIGFALRVYVDPSQTGSSGSMIRVHADGGVYAYGYVLNGRPVVGVAGAVGGSAIYAVSVGDVTTPAWLMLGGHISFSATTARIVATCNGSQTYSTYTLPAGFRNANARINTAVEFDTDVPFTDFSCWQSPTEPVDEWPGETHVPQARLDRGRNDLLGIPAISGVDSWSLIKEVTAAEFGTCGFDEDGVFEFRARAAGGVNLAPKVVSSERGLSDLVVKIDEAAVRNVITGSVAAYLIDDYEDVFESTAVDQMDCGPGVTIFEFPIDPNVLALADAPLNWQLMENFAEASKLYKYRDAARFCVVNSAAPQTVVDVVAGGNKLFISDSIPRPGVLRLRITNNTSVSIRFATPSAVDGNGVVTSEGQPAFKLGGRVVREQPEQTVTVQDDGSIITYGERAYDLGGKSRFRQHLDSVSGIASAVLASTAQPAPVLDAITVPHDPRRKLRDRVRIVDKTGQGEIVGTVVGIKSTFDSKATDVLTVRPIGPPGLGILDDPSLGLVGSTLVFGA